MRDREVGGTGREGAGEWRHTHLCLGFDGDSLSVHGPRGPARITSVFSPGVERSSRAFFDSMDFDRRIWVNLGLGYLPSPHEAPTRRKNKSS